MTPLQMIDRAKTARVSFAVADAGEHIVVNVTKEEAKRLARDHVLPPIDAEDVGAIGWVGLSKDGKLVTIGFRT